MRDAGGLHAGQDRDQRQLDLGEQPVDALVAERLLERRPDRERGQRLEARRRDGRQARGRRRQHEVQPLPDDVGDLLRPQRGVDEVGGDLGVEVHGERRGRGVVGEPGGQQRLHVVPDEAGVDRLEELAQGDRGVDAVGGDHPAVVAGHGQRQRRAGERARVVDDEAGPDRLAITEPRLERRDAVRLDDLDPTRVHDRGRQRAGQVAGRGRERLRPRLDRRRGRGDRAGVALRRPAAASAARDDVEVHRQLQLPGVHGAAPAAACAPDALGRREPGLAERAHRGDRVLGPLPDEGRQPVDQRPELELAEQPDHLLAVVLPHPPARRVQGDVDVAHEPHQLAALEHGFAVLLERDAQLLRGDLVDVLVQGVQRAPRRDQLRGGLLADPGDAGDVVGRIALERLVVEHLLGPQAPPLLDLREVVGHGVRDAATQRDHQLRVLADELQHVEVAGEDRGVETEALGLPDERGDGVVGLEPLLLVLGDVQGAHDLLHLGDLLAHVVGHARPGRLVLRVAVVPERAGRQVERDRHPVGLHVLDRPQHDVREPEHGGHELALGRRQGLLDEREVATVDEPVAVEQQEAFHRLRACGVGRVKCTRGPGRNSS